MSGLSRPGHWIHYEYQTTIGADRSCAGRIADLGTDTVGIGNETERIEIPADSVRNGTTVSG